MTQERPSERETLAQLRHFKVSVLQMFRELQHGVHFAVDEESSFRSAKLTVPGAQFGTIGMVGISIDGADPRPDGY